MTIQTNRLTLRQVSITDLDKIHELHSLPQTDQFNTLGIPDTINTTQGIVNEWLIRQKSIPQTLYIFCIDKNDTRQFIGLIGLNLGRPDFRTAEVWYKIHVDHWKQGYATEALNKILEFGFKSLKLHRIEAGCAVENVASGKVLEKAGMTKEGMKRKKLPIRGEWKDNNFYAILEDDFLRFSHYLPAKKPLTIQSGFDESLL